MKKYIILILILVCAVIVLAATEDFTTYNETDNVPVNITVAADCITWTHLNSEGDYVYKDIADVTGDYRHEFKFRYTEVHTEEIGVTYDFTVYGLSNGNTGDIFRNGEEFAGVMTHYDSDADGGTLFIKLYVYDAATFHDATCSKSVTSYDPTDGTWFYVSVERDDDGGDGKGLYSLYVCLDTYYSEGGTPIGGAAATCHLEADASKIDFLYVYAICDDSVSAFDSDGEMCGLNLSVGDRSEFVPQISFIDD